MAKKKKDENEETLVDGAETAAEETAVETATGDSSDMTAEASASEAPAEEVLAETAQVETVETAAEEPVAVEEPVTEETKVEAAPAAEKPKRTSKAAPKAKATKKAVETSPADTKKLSKRAEKIGIVSSDKMMKTVTVRVDRLVKHPVYRKYVKKRKKFMAHDEMGSKIGDKVKIVETRPLSARKRWRVVEIIHRAES